MRDNLENGMIRDEDEGDIIEYCEWCGEPIYAGARYYEIGDENVCEDCILSARKTA